MHDFTLVRLCPLLTLGLTLTHCAVDSSSTKAENSGGNSQTTEEGGNTTISTSVTDSNIASVSPVIGYLARTSEITIVGSGTNWTSNTMPNLGDGITIDNIELIDSQTLIASITIADDATLGDRTLTVSDENGSLTFAEPFQVASPIKVTASADIARGSYSPLTIELVDQSELFSYDASDFTTSTSNGIHIDATTTLAIGSDTNLTTSVAIDLSAEVSFVDFTLIATDPTTGDTVLFPSGPALTIESNEPTTVSLGTPINVTVDHTGQNNLFEFTAPESGNVEFGCDAKCYLLSTGGIWTNAIGPNSTYYFFFTIDPGQTYYLSCDASDSYTLESAVH